MQKDHYENKAKYKRKPGQLYTDNIYNFVVLVPVSIRKLLDAKTFRIS